MHRLQYPILNCIFKFLSYFLVQPALIFDKIQSAVMRSFSIFFVSLSLIFSCTSKQKSEAMSDMLQASPAIEGSNEYIGSPYVTAGDRVYMVGHQDGSFPELGWHVKGEMGGIWLHPIKLMDGFQAALLIGDESHELSEASKFVNYPTANVHYYDLESTDLSVERWQFVPDGKQGLAVQYILRNNGQNDLEVQLDLTGHADLSPVWLGERTEMKDGKDSATFDQNLNGWLVKDDLSPWHLVYGLDVAAAEYNEEANELLGNGISNRIRSNLKIPAGSAEQVNLVIAGSKQSEEEAVESYKDIKTNFSLYLNEKINRMETLASQSKLTIPDKDLEQTFEWLKYNCDWLVRTVPGIGTGISAGIPDYPWWFGVDSEYSLRGYMAVGQTMPVYETIKLLDSVSNAVNGNGRIIHEMSTNGAVFNEGNINETPQFASLIWEIYLWNGDKDFLTSYYPTIKKGLKWLMDENDSNKNLFPDGFGMMEIHGLDSEMIDVASYTQRAFEDASKIAAELDDEEVAAEYIEIANDLKQRINEDFWSEEFASYADFIGTDKQTLHLIEDAIVRADTLNKPWAIEELEQTQKAILQNPSSDPRPFVLHHNWVVNTPMEMGIADEDKAIRALETAEKFVNPFGVFVTGIDRDESAGSDDGSFAGSKVFSYTGAVMTLPTGVQAIAENNYGRPDKALDYIKRMTRSFSYALPGSMYEVSPDYGMMTQAWNIYSYAVPIVQQFFGIQPKASEKKVVISPNMPSEWSEAKLENVIIADNSISIFHSVNDKKKVVEVHQSNPEWTVELRLQNPEGYDYQLVEGNAELSSEDSLITATGKGSKLVLEIISQ